jgi:hypothetical protein
MSADRNLSLHFAKWQTRMRGLLLLLCFASFVCAFDPARIPVPDLQAVEAAKRSGQRLVFGFFSAARLDVLGSIVYRTSDGREIELTQVADDLDWVKALPSDYAYVGVVETFVRIERESTFPANAVPTGATLDQAHASALAGIEYIEASMRELPLRDTNVRAPRHAAVPRAAQRMRAH